MAAKKLTSDNWLAIRSSGAPRTFVDAQEEDGEDIQRLAIINFTGQFKTESLGIGQLIDTTSIDRMSH